uniref:Uncharacterized protein n=1 Tax=Arundo donax TaxID=35708 RepID=A0A0A9DP17_ARUDO
MSEQAAAYRNARACSSRRHRTSFLPSAPSCSIRCQLLQIWRRSGLQRRRRRRPDLRHLTAHTLHAAVSPWPLHTSPSYGMFGPPPSHMVLDCTDLLEPC